MLSKILSTFLVFVLVGQVSASTDGGGLKQVFDEYNYALTVEWDQKDQNFYLRETSLFVERIKELQSQGVSNTDLINEAVSSVNDEKTSNEIKSLISLLDQNKLTFEETKNLIKRTMMNSKQQGASWNEEVALKVWISFLIVAISTATILTIINSDGSSEPRDDWSCANVWHGSCMDNDPYYPR